MKRFAIGLGVLLAVALTAGAIFLSVASASGKREMVGAVASRGAVSLEVSDQLGVQQALTIDRVRVPRASWIAVYSEGMGGMPGARAGIVHVPAGDTRGVKVPLDAKVRLTENAIVVLHLDGGVPGRFEFDDARFDTSTDKPYWSGGSQVQKKVWVRFYEMGNAFRS